MTKPSLFAMALWRHWPSRVTLARLRQHQHTFLPAHVTVPTASARPPRRLKNRLRPLLSPTLSVCTLRRSFSLQARPSINHADPIAPCQVRVLFPVRPCRTLHHLFFIQSVATMLVLFAAKWQPLLLALTCLGGSLALPNRHVSGPDLQTSALCSQCMFQQARAVSRKCRISARFLYCGVFRPWRLQYPTASAQGGRSCACQQLTPGHLVCDKTWR
jgi:hypothetical protein